MTIRNSNKSTIINIMIEYPSGDKEYFQNGKRHRDNDLPSVVYVSGYKEWFQNGERHRDNDLPAIEYANGYKEWFKNGIYYLPNKKKV